MPSYRVGLVDRARIGKNDSLAVLVMSPSNHKKDCKVMKDARPRILPAGTPEWITAELIEATIRVWQPYYQATLTPDEAVTMIQSVGRLYEVLSSGSSP